MPIYEYKCPEGHIFEVFQRMADPSPEACEICGDGPIERVLYPVAVHFKGSGFYTTDYGRGANRRDGTKDGDAVPKPGGDSAGKEEKKPKPAEA